MNRLPVFVAILLTILVALKLSSSQIGYQILSTNTSIATVNVSQGPPIVSGVFVEDVPTNVPPDEIDLIAGGVKLVKCNGTISDPNGAADIVKANATFYDMGSTARDCGANYNNMYINDSCELTVKDTTTKIATCYFWVWYHASPTVDLDYPWTCELYGWDSNNSVDVGMDNTSMNTLLAIGTQQVLSFGIRQPAQNDSYVSTNHTSYNYGNMLFDVGINGTDMGCAVGSIPVGYLKYNCTTFNSTYDSAASLTTTLTSTNCQEFDLDKTFTSSGAVSPSSKKSYWGIGIPPAVKGNCQGTIWFGAVQNPLIWHADIDISELDGSGDSEPEIDYSSTSKVYILWKNVDLGLRFRSSSDDGASWSSVTSPNDTSAQGMTPSRFASSGNTIHVAWIDIRDGIQAVYYSNSTDAGATWNVPNYRLTTIDAASYEHDITSSGNNVYVVWDSELYDNLSTSKTETNIQIRNSTNAGASWNSVYNVTKVYVNVSDSFPRMALVGSVIHLFFFRENVTSSEIKLYYTNSTNGGVSWTSPIAITTLTMVPTGLEVGANSNTLYAVFTDPVTNNLKLYRSADSGLTWTGYTLHSNAGDPDIAVQGNNITVVFEDQNQNVVRLVQSDDNWGKYELNSHIIALHGCAAAYPLSPVVTLNYGQIHLAWVDSRFTLAASDEVYYKAFR